MSTFSPAYPFTAALCVGGGYPLKIVCHNRVVGLPHDVTARLVMILLTCLPKAVKGYRTAGSVGGQAELRYSPPFADCVAECDRWFGVGSGPAEVTTIAEPLHRAPGETTRLSEGGSGGSDTAQGTTVSESSPLTNGEPALSGVGPFLRAAETGASTRAHNDPVRQSEKSAGGSGSAHAAVVSEPPPGGDGEPARLSGGSAGDSRATAVSKPPLGPAASPSACPAETRVTPAPPGAPRYPNPPPEAAASTPNCPEG